MAMDNVQTVDRSQTVKKEDKEKTIYSINLKQSTVDKAKKLMAKRDELIAQLNANIAEGVERGATTEQLVGSNMVIAANIGELEKKINILSAMQGPVETQGTRALRLIQKMIKEVKRKSDIIYAVDDKKEEIVPEPTPGEASVIVEVPAVNVQQIAADNNQIVGQSIEDAIDAEKAINENNIKEVAKTSLGTVPTQQEVLAAPSTEVVAEVNQPLPVNVVRVDSNDGVGIVPVEVVPETVPETVPVVENSIPQVTVPVEVASVVPTIEGQPVKNEVDLEEQNRINNETMKNAYENEMANASEYEYVPMTEEEVAESQRKLEETAKKSDEAKHQRIIEEEARKEKEVAAINESKGFDFDSIPTVTSEPEVTTESEKPLRDEIQIPADREFEVEEKVEEEKEEVQESKEKPVLIKTDDEPSKGVIASSWEKEEMSDAGTKSIEELAELYEKELELKKQREEERTESEKKLQELKEDYAKLIENESATEKQLEELTTEEEEKIKKLNELKNKLTKVYELTKDTNSDLLADTQKNHEESSSIKEDGDRRYERLESLNSEVASKKANIAKIDEAIAKYGYIDESDSIRRAK